VSIRGCIDTFKQSEKPCSSYELQGFFFGLYFCRWLGYGVRLFKGSKMQPHFFDAHSVGYLIIALVYITLAFMK